MTPLTLEKHIMHHGAGCTVARLDMWGLAHASIAAVADIAP